jgi:hypothetical protein
VSYITRANDEMSPGRALQIVLGDAQPDGLTRTLLIERAAEIRQTTQANVEDTLKNLRKYGEVYEVDGEFQLTSSRESELDWGGGFS